MTSTDVRRKALAQFNALDTDRDGYIDRSDYESTARRILQAFGVDAAAPEAAALVDGYVNLFDRLSGRVDLDQDDRVSAEEFLEAVQDDIRRSDGKEFEEVAQAIATVCDGNRDGYISSDDYRRFLIVVGSAPAHAAENARGVTGDNGGLLSRDLLVGAVKAFYTDPRAV